MNENDNKCTLITQDSSQQLSSYIFDEAPDYATITPILIEYIVDMYLYIYIYIDIWNLLSLYSPQALRTF